MNNGKEGQPNGHKPNPTESTLNGHNWVAMKFNDALAPFRLHRAMFEGRGELDIAGGIKIKGPATDPTVSIRADILAKLPEGILSAQTQNGHLQNGHTNTPAPDQNTKPIV